MTAHPTTTIFEASAHAFVAAPARRIYRYVSDLRNSGTWSPECLGGEWITGEPAKLGAVFRGHNCRQHDVVSWAPVVRGHWYTEAEVVAADEPTIFSWAMRDSRGRIQESVWSFRIDESATATGLTHSFVMRSLTEGMNEILSAMEAFDRDRFISEWQAKLEQDLNSSVGAIKRQFEQAIRS